MQCANLLRKRRGGEEEAAWSCREKRACLGAGLQTLDCPMEIDHSLTLTNQQPERQVRANAAAAAALCCPRCLGGEPGHINHILGH